MKDLQALISRLRESCPELELRENEPMSRHTSFRVGGPVPLMALPRSEDEARKLVTVAVREFGEPPFFMGNGTNLLVADQGADLLVVKTVGLDYLALTQKGEWPDRRTILAGSGVSLARLSNFALENGLTGLEFAHGIPGSVGGGVYMNAGAYGGELGQVISSAAKLSFAAQTPSRPRGAPEFSYRYSIYQEQPDTLILRAGSTAIANIQAKPIIDILVEISPDADWQDVKAVLETAGYICMSSTGNHMGFNKGYTPEGYADRVFHIHIHAIGDNDEIIFRDYLNSHPEVAREYEALKLSLLPQFKNDRDGYTDAKTDFIKRVLNNARN